MKMPNIKANFIGICEYWALLVELYYYKLPEAVSHEGHPISGSFYNKVLYQILLTHLLSLNLLAEPLDYRIYTFDTAV